MTDMRGHAQYVDPAAEGSGRVGIDVTITLGGNAGTIRITGQDLTRDSVRDIFTILAEAGYALAIPHQAEQSEPVTLGLFQQHDGPEGQSPMWVGVHRMSGQLMTGPAVTFYVPTGVHGDQVPSGADVVVQPGGFYTVKQRPR